MINTCVHDDWVLCQGGCFLETSSYFLTFLSILSLLENEKTYEESWIDFTDAWRNEKCRIILTTFFPCIIEKNSAQKLWCYSQKLIRSDKKSISRKLAACWNFQFKEIFSSCLRCVLILFYVIPCHTIQCFCIEILHQVIRVL